MRPLFNLYYAYFSFFAILLVIQIIKSFIVESSFVNPKSSKGHYNMLQMDYNTEGKLMKNITNCFYNRFLLPENIFIIMYVTSDYLSEYKFNIESVKIYSKLHGYSFKVVDQLEIFKKYGKLPADHFKNEKGSIVSSKILIIQCMTIIIHIIKYYIYFVRLY